MDILKNKAYKTYNRLSRYMNYPYYYNTMDKKYQTGMTTHLSTSTTYIAYKVQQGDTYDSIALTYYNNPTYYWVILDFNRIKDALEEPKLGTVLKIPVLSTIAFEE